MAKNRERIKALKDGIATLENDKEKLAIKRLGTDEALDDISQMLANLQAIQEARAYKKTFANYGKWQSEIKQLKKTTQGDESKANKDAKDGNRHESAQKRAIANVHDFSKEWYQRKELGNSGEYQYYDAEREQLVTEIKRAIEELKKEVK